MYTYLWFNLNRHGAVVEILFPFFFFLSFAKKEDVKDFWLAQGLNEAIPLLEVITA